MALIGSIRKRGWILIVLMALALGGFILMDVMSNSQRYSAGDVNSLGKVGDTEIKRSEFDSYEKLVYTNATGNNTYQVRGQVWSYFLEQAIVDNEASKMGMGVGKEELMDLQFGQNLSPIIADRFKNAAGQPDRAKLASIKGAIEQGQFTDPRGRAYWAVQEKEIIKERLQEKIITAISKGMYTPKWQAEMVFHENNDRRDFIAVNIPYDKVKDEDAPVTDSDYEAFLKESPNYYDQDNESRVISFLSFDVVPSQADSLLAKESIKSLIEGLRTAKNDSSYVVANGGSFANLFVPKDKFPAASADSVMSRPIGSIVGPILDQGEWSIIKILDRKVLPDSVKARHILIRDATPENESRADSMIALIKSGKVRFDSLAISASQDPGSGQKGGDLGWFANGSMVLEFNNLCFLTGEQGKIYKISTQFGWHIVEITGKKFIKNETSAKVAVLSRRVEPGKSTQQSVKDKASAFVQQAKTIADLEALAGKQNLKLQNTKAIGVSEFNLGTLVGEGDDAREIVRWAFDDKTKVGSVSKEVFAFGDAKGGYFDSRYMVAALKSIIPKGKASVATLKSLEEAVARVKIIKKGEYIKSKIQSGTDLVTVVSQWPGTRIDTLRRANFLQTSNEPRVTGTLFSLETGKISDPIISNMGVIVLQPIADKTQPQMPADITLFRRQVSSQTSGAMRTSLMKSLERQYEIKDNRYKFW
jgi:peptidyl-prolyl cis-trans isomerase D